MIKSQIQFSNCPARYFHFIHGFRVQRVRLQRERATFFIEKKPTFDGIIDRSRVFFLYSYFRMSRNIEAFSLCVFIFFQTLRVVPHGMKATGPRFVTRPAYLRSQFRNNTNTVSTLVPLIHLLHVLCTQYSGVAHHRALQTSG